MLSRRNLMRLTGACAVSAANGSSWIAAQEARSATRLPRDNLAVFRDKSGKTQEVMTVDDWQIRRQSIVQAMESIMGKLPGAEKRCPLDLKIEEEFDGGSYVRRLVTYASEPGSRVPAYLLIPKSVMTGKIKAPAALCLHGTNNVVGHGRSEERRVGKEC